MTDQSTKDRAAQLFYSVLEDARGERKYRDAQGRDLVGLLDRVEMSAELRAILMVLIHDFRWRP